MRSDSEKFFWIFTVGLSLILLFKLPMQGMFFDGLTYSSISKNLAVGIGTFWNPQYTQTLYPVFHEHPPLAFFLQSMFFKALGDHFWIEKLYSLVAAGASVFFIRKIWFHITDSYMFSWLPVLLWIITPIVSWSFSNNMLENTVSVFVLAATWLIVRAVKEDNYILMLLASSILFAANLVKGLTPLFPVALPFIYALIVDRNKLMKGFTGTIILFTIPVLITVALMAFSDSAHAALIDYFNSQVLKSLEGKRELANSRFSILGDLLSQIVVTGAPLILLMIFYFKKFGMRIKREATLMMLLAFAASLPLLISPKQMGYYLVPSIPFFSLAIALIMIPYVDHLYSIILERNKSIKVIKLVSAFVLTGSFVLWFFCFGKPGRDQKIVSDLLEIKRLIPEREIVSVCPSSMEDWTSHAYLQRFASISLSADKGHPYFIAEESCIHEVDGKYQEMNVLTERYHIYKREN